MFQLFTAKFQRFLSLHNSNYFGTLCNAALQRLTFFLFGSKRTNLRALGCQRQRNIRNLICKLCDFFSLPFFYIFFVHVPVKVTSRLSLLILCIMMYIFFSFINFMHYGVWNSSINVSSFSFQYTYFCEFYKNFRQCASKNDKKGHFSHANCMLMITLSYH